MKRVIPGAQKMKKPNPLTKTPAMVKSVPNPISGFSGGGGVTGAEMKKFGRNLARAKNQK